MAFGNGVLFLTLASSNKVCMQAKAHKKEAFFNNALAEPVQNPDHRALQKNPLT
jgi:hypothetical protein